MSVEGIPNGWRLVRVGRVHHGETRIDTNGNPLKWSGLEPSQSKNLVIIEMIKDSKQYREPDLSDLANGPIEIEACTPDPHTGERRWRKRKLVAIHTVARKPFVCRHPNHRVLVCYKEARIEVVASSEASPADHIADAKKMVPLAIPAGWRELHNGEALSKADLYDCNGKWNPYTDSNPAGSDFPEYNKAIHYRHIRKIETANQSERQSLAIPEGWRELDESDYIEQSDKYDDGNRWMPYTYDPASPKSVRFNKSIHVRHIRKIKEPATDHIADADKMVSPAIPAGWRELHNGEALSKADLYELNGEWTACKHDPLGDRYSSRIHCRHIRKIETASQTDNIDDVSKKVPPNGYRLLDKSAKVEPRKAGDLYWSSSIDDWVELAEFGVEYANRDDWPACRKAEQVPHVKVTIYREPTQRDLANGPIRCRVRDSKEDMWLDRDLHAVMPETVIGRFVTISEDKRNVGSWVYCEIPSDHQEIRVGDLVKVTARQLGVYRVGWVNEMNRQVNKVAKVAGITHDGRFLLNGCGGWRFHRDWLELVETASEAKGGEA